MIALDTNVIVRFLVMDDRKQSSRARLLITSAIADNTQLYVSDIVACEVVWVLESAYDFGREKISTVLHQLLGARHLTFRSTDLMTQAVEAYGAGRGDFADYLIRADALAAGCETVATFDKALHREDSFSAP